MEGERETSGPLGASPSGFEQPGDVVGSYTLVRKIGEGSMGRVYLARHLRLAREVALKILRPEHARNPDLVQRFFQEARAVNQINHEHIVEISDFADESRSGGHVYYVMEMLEGKALSELSASEKMSISRLVSITRQLCSALEAAHRVGVIHRDVKPDNVFVTKREGRADYVKVLDFGVAKLTRRLEGLTTGQTLEGLIIGTPDYMSPEQAMGRPADERTDVYGTGVVLYQLLTGHLPFNAESLAEQLTQIVRTPPRTLPRVTPWKEPIPDPLAGIALRCLEKEPGRRFSSMRALSSALEPFSVGSYGGAVRRFQHARVVALGATASLAVAVAAFAWPKSSAPGAPPSSPAPLTLEGYAKSTPVPSEVHEVLAQAHAEKEALAVAGNPGASVQSASPEKKTSRPKARARRATRNVRSIDDVINPFED